MLTEGRERMVATQIAARGITDPRVLAAMRTVPRERFVPSHLAELAYQDGPPLTRCDQCGRSEEENRLKPSRVLHPPALHAPALHPPALHPRSS